LRIANCQLSIVDCESSHLVDIHGCAVCVVCVVMGTMQSSQQRCGTGKGESKPFGVIFPATAIRDAERPAPIQWQRAIFTPGFPKIGRRLTFRRRGNSWRTAGTITRQASGTKRKFPALLNAMVCVFELLSIERWRPVRLCLASQAPTNRRISEAESWEKFS